MKLFNLFKRKANYTFNEEDREFSKDIRAKKRELELLRMDNDIMLEQKRKELQILKLENEISEYMPEQEEGPFDKLKELMSLAPLLGIQNNNSLPQQVSNAVTSPQKEQNVEVKTKLTEQEIRTLLKQIPFFLKRSLLKKPDAELKEFIKQYRSDIDEESINLTIQIARE